MFALFQGPKNIYNEHVIYFVLAMVPSVITTIPFHNFCFSWNFENDFYASFTDNEIFRFGNGVF